ncbi:TorF family putative porin [Pseudobacteriovorax antillogorgiicola]|uniref:Outer membrane protein beta-barrel domain-containing protein n=1 Tax=Pseudobacteriovorax antillogorgiicola TaxID=1513793 RepID=A0A1Y6CSL2_9BACT|nr:TorF family putative porin [Pseudobacteriovorax antillogorgiicola]TCS45022.1 uncharacterized protein (TIGR02001 family) [Pseudobacteriovorax antillogorgiicola]SMF76258.1 conserved hypothetical protein [Pseudobacteriovorax antillogorgiicola]
MYTRFIQLITGVLVLLAGKSWAAEMSMSQSTKIETSASVDVVSAYIFRGATLNKGAAVQPGVEMAIGGATIGVWGSQAMDAEETETEQEVDVYASYDIDLSGATLTFGAVEYIYPGEDIDNDREVSIGIGFDTFLSPSIAVNYGIGGAVEETSYTEFGIEEGVFEEGDFSASLGAAVGYLDPEGGTAGFSHTQLIASASFSMISASLNYFLEMDDEVQSFEDAEEFYVSVGTAYAF